MYAALSSSLYCELNYFGFFPFMRRSPLFCKQAWKLWNEEKGVEFIDKNIADECPVSEAVRWIHIALLCVQEDPNDRPLMSSVVLMLGSKWVNLPQPSAPPFSVGRFVTSHDQRSISGLGFPISDQSSTSASVLFGDSPEHA